MEHEVILIVLYAPRTVSKDLKNKVGEMDVIRRVETIRIPALLELLWILRSSYEEFAQSNGA